MAIERVLNIVANAKQATSEINDLYKKLLEAEKANQALNDTAEETGDAYKDTAKETTKAVDKIGDSANKQTRVMKGLGNAVKAVGTSLKALGIGLIIALVAKFTQVLSENQKVVDTVNSVSNTLGIIINQLINSFSEIFGKIGEVTGGFNALKEVVGSSLKIAFNTLKLVVLELQAGFTALKLAYEKVFGDDEGVEKAKKDLEEIGNKLVDTLKDSKSQAENVVKNVGEAVGEIVDGVTILAKEGTKAISEIDVAASYAQAKAITEARKNFEILALQQARLQLQYQNQAELQRQIRDDDSRGISERIKANDDLAKILDKQFEAESRTIKARIAGLQQEQMLLGFNQDRQNEIYQLQTDLIDVEERLNGARSEQLTNTNSLLREQKDLIQSQVDTQNELALKQKEFEAEQEETELAKLERQREALELQREQDLAELERKRELYKEETQARVDAENEFLLRQQEINQALIENTKARTDEETRIEKAAADAKVEIQSAYLDNVSAGIGLLKSLGEKSKALQKATLIAENAAAIARTIQNTVVANAKAVAASPLTGGQPFVAINQISAGIGIASSIAATVKGLKELGGGSAGSAPSIPQGGGASAPSFNLVEGTGTNQIAQSIAQERTPVQAFVVSSSVTSRQELDRNAEREASI